MYQGIYSQYSYPMTAYPMAYPGLSANGQGMGGYLFQQPQPKAIPSETASFLREYSDKDWLLLQEELEREMLQAQQAKSGKPASESQSGLKALLAVKSVGAALAVGGVASLLFGVNPLITIGAEAVSGVIETWAADKILNSSSPTMKKFLTKLYQWRTGDQRHITHLTDAQKSQCIAPVSALLSGANTLVTAGLSYALGGKALHGTPTKTPKKGFLSTFRQLGTKLQNLKFVKWINKRPLVAFGITLAVGMAFGLLEGFMAEGMGHKAVEHSQHPNSNPHLTRDSFQRQ